MRLLGRVIVEKRAIVLPIALAIAANLAAYFFIVYPLQARVSSGEARLQADERARRTAERDLVGARATREGQIAAEAALQKFYHQVLPGTLADARKAAYVRLSQIAAESNLRYQGQTANETILKDSDLTKVTITIVLNGSYQDVRKFMHALETIPEFLVIDNMALTSHDDPNSPLVLTLTVSTYFRTAGNAI